jgi:hypothetical protein
VCIEASVCLIRIDLRPELTLVVFKIRLPRVYLRRSVVFKILPPSSVRILVKVVRVGGGTIKVVAGIRPQAGNRHPWGSTKLRCNFDVLVDCLLLSRSIVRVV